MRPQLDEELSTMIFRLGIMLVCFLGVPATAAADCLYDGKWYPENARIGVLVCENGQWVLRP